MKNLRTLGLVVSLLLVLAVNSFAGDMNCPVAPPPPVQPQAVQVGEPSNSTTPQGQNAASESDVVIDYATALIQTLARLF